MAQLDGGRYMKSGIIPRSHFSEAKRGSGLRVPGMSVGIFLQIPTFPAACSPKAKAKTLQESTKALKQSAAPHALLNIVYVSLCKGLWSKDAQKKL